MTAPDRSPATEPMEPARDHGVVERLQFPDIPRLELDQLLEQLRDGAQDVLATQGRLRGLLRANAAVAADLSLPALLRHIVDAARDLLRARYAAIIVLGRDAQLHQFVHAGMDEDLVARINHLPRGQRVLDLLTVGSDLDLPAAPPTESPRSAPGHTPVGGFLGVAIANAGLLTESERRRRWLAASSRLTNQLLAADTRDPCGVSAKRRRQRRTRTLRT